MLEEEERRSSLLLEDEDRYLETALIPPPPPRRCPRVTLPRPRLFLAKTLFVWAASFAFVPLIAANQSGRISALVYAVILVLLHVVFLVVYFWRVRLRELDSNWRSLAARCAGLLASVYILYLVAGSLSTSLSILSLQLLGLCLVHTWILLLLTCRVNPNDEPKPLPEPHYEDQIVA